MTHLMLAPCGGRSGARGIFTRGWAAGVGGVFLRAYARNKELGTSAGMVRNADVRVGGLAEDASQATRLNVAHSECWVSPNWHGAGVGLSTLRAIAYFG